MDPVPTKEGLRGVVRDAVGDLRLLGHPFYRRWEAGELGRAELGRYAEQYRHLEAKLPEVLEAVAIGLGNARAEELVRENLADERGDPVPHLTMFELFASRVGADPSADPGPATERLVSLQLHGARRSPAAGIAVLAAYESQAAEVARSKAAGLRRHYGVDALGTWFWDVHGAVEDRHADWSLEALAVVGAPVAEVAEAARAAARAWWEFLDEREAARAA